MGVYAKRAFLHTSDRFLAGLYAEWPVLHTSGWFLDGLYAGMAVLHTDWEENHQAVESLGRDLEQKRPKMQQVPLYRSPFAGRDLERSDAGSLKGKRKNGRRIADRFCGPCRA